MSDEQQNDQNTEQPEVKAPSIEDIKTPPGFDPIWLIYARHPGPYSLIQIRLVNGDQVMGKCLGPLIARAAHEESRRIIEAPGSDVINISVFSETEHIFIGAGYKRGAPILPWWDERGPHGLGNFEGQTGDNYEAGTLIKSVRRQRNRKAKPARPPRSASAESGPAKPRASGDAPRLAAVRGRALELDPGNAEQWPKSPGPTRVRAWFEEEPERKATVAEIVQAIGEELRLLGVGFPGSLISRLKQAGLLREA